LVTGLVKRVMDLAAVVVLTPIALPLCLLLALIIRSDSKGNPLFAQERIGRHGRPFRMLKLRTMAADTADLPSHEAPATSITSIGLMLRRFKLDELPQLWNVLTGAMTLVGPRPCLPIQVELIAEREARGLFAIRPGITGPAQLGNIDMSDPVRLAQVEARYFCRSTTFSDIKIVLQTALGGGSGDPALIAGRSR
jgi:lipopolysaccharide/colanic/teichoic acid biosynthesis glycosyltransferase